MPESQGQRLKKLLKGLHKNLIWQIFKHQMVGLNQKVLSGESNEVPAHIVEEFISKFPIFARGFKDEDIFNADECGLFFKAMPDKSLVIKGDKCKSGKVSKERFTVLLCASACGEKLKPLVIGKSAKPRAFKKLKPEDLPVTWRSNKSAWMTAVLFEEWVRSVDQEMKKKKRSILLTVDNCPAHPQVSHLTNVTLRFLPPNTTSKIQPLDQGVIKAFKMFYRAQLLEWVIGKTQMCPQPVEATSFAASINALDSILWINSAWEKIQPQTIQKCFRKVGFVITQQSNILASSDSSFPMAEFEGVDFDSFVEMDDQVATCNEPDPEAIFQAILTETQTSLELDESPDKLEEANEDKEEISQTPKEEVVSQLIVQLKLFAAEKCPGMLSSVAGVESAFFTYICNKNKKQTKIETFFRKND